MSSENSPTQPVDSAYSVEVTASYTLCKDVEATSATEAEEKAIREMKEAMDNGEISLDDLHLDARGKLSIDSSVGISDTVPRDQLTETGKGEDGPVYQCPRCEYPYVSEHCDCPRCGWAGMCQEDWD